MKAVTYKKINNSVINEWRSLWEKSPDANYTNSPEWFLSVIESFEYKDYVIIALYEKEKMTSIGALVKDKQYGVEFYTIAPGDFVCGASFLLDLENKTAIEMFIKKLLELGNVFLNNVSQTFLTTLKQQTPYINETFQAVNIYLQVKKNDQGSVLISKRSRLMNRIKGEEENFQLRSFNGTTSKGLDIAFSLDNESSKQAKGYSTFSDNKIKIFYKALAHNLKKNFCVDVLYFNDKPIAYYIGFLAGSTYYWSQNAFISEYGQYSPGKVLLVKLIEYWGSKNITVINFGSGDNRMKRLLSNDYNNFYQVVLSKNSLIRAYLKNLNKAKNTLYERLHANTGFYSFYRKIKHISK